MGIKQNARQDQKQVKLTTTHNCRVAILCLEDSKKTTVIHGTDAAIVDRGQFIIYSIMFIVISTVLSNCYIEGESIAMVCVHTNTGPAVVCENKSVKTGAPKPSVTLFTTVFAASIHL